MYRLLKKLGYTVFLFVLWPSSAVAKDSFIVKDIRVEGLERISPGTVFNYLPIRVGDEFDASRSAEAVRALFKTGFFRDVRLERESSQVFARRLRIRNGTELFFPATFGGYSIRIESIDG